MDTEEFIKTYPFVFHMAEDGAWPTVQQLGLLSTTALLDRFEVQGKRREELESQRRPGLEKLEHAVHGCVVIRDNKPLREQFLRSCLTGMEPRDWYRLLNRKVFFWVRRERLDTLSVALPNRVIPVRSAGGSQNPAPIWAS